MSKILPQWQAIIERESQQPYFIKLQQTLNYNRSKGERIFPDEQDVFSAFHYCDLRDIKVVILGQDPYHGVGDNNQPQAHGLAFSVNRGIKVPPSLVNIFKELTSDIDGFKAPNHGYLAEWAKQGVLLLNTVLTVKEKTPNAHAKLGWETFTDAIINELNEKNEQCVFMLWGKHAHKKGKNIDTNKHLILKEVHPSPLSAYRGFFGCKHFSIANHWLASRQKSMINWHLASHPTIDNP